MKQKNLFAESVQMDPPRVGSGALRAYRIPVYTISLVREGSVQTQRRQVRSSPEAADIFRCFLGDVDREHFMVMMLDRKNRVIGINTVAVGSLDSAIVHPREVMKPAVLMSAAAVICCHNHPSGDCEPSEQDNKLTRRLVDAGRVLGISLLDHLILGEGETYAYSAVQPEVIGG